MENIKKGICTPKKFNLNYIYVEKLSPIVIEEIIKFLEKHTNTTFQYTHLRDTVLFTSHDNIYSFEMSNKEFLVISFGSYGGFLLNVFSEINFNDNFNLI